MKLFREKPDHRLRILEVMQREHLLPPHANADFEAAKQRCLACRSEKLCDEGNTRLALFCPNIHYLQTLKKGSGPFFA